MIWLFILNIISDFPESKAAIEDLKFCLERTNQRQQLLTSLKSAFESRLLHPGWFLFVTVKLHTCTVFDGILTMRISFQGFTHLTSLPFTSQPLKLSESWTHLWSSCKLPVSLSASTLGETGHYFSFFKQHSVMVNLYEDTNHEVDVLIILVWRLNCYVFEGCRTTTTVNSSKMTETYETLVSGLEKTLWGRL